MDEEKEYELKNDTPLLLVKMNKEAYQDVQSILYWKEFPVVRNVDSLPKTRSEIFDLTIRWKEISSSKIDSYLDLFSQIREGIDNQEVHVVLFWTEESGME